MNLCGLALLLFHGTLVGLFGIHLPDKSRPTHTPATPRDCIQCERGCDVTGALGLGKYRERAALRWERVYHSLSVCLGVNPQA